jgi:hypothetical protein
MKRYVTLTLAALALSATTAAQAFTPKPLFSTSDYQGWFTIDNVVGFGPCGNFSMNGVVGLDGAGNIINEGPPNSSYVNVAYAPLPGTPSAACVAAHANVASFCQYNIFSPSPGEVSGPGGSTYSVASDAELRLPIKYRAFLGQSAICNSANGTISTLSGIVNNLNQSSLGITGGAAANGALNKMHKP